MISRGGAATSTTTRRRQRGEAGRTEAEGGSLLKCRCLELGLEPDADGRTGASAVDTWEAMTSQYCRKRRKKVLVSAEIAVPDTDRESNCWRCQFS